MEIEDIITSKTTIGTIDWYVKPKGSYLINNELSFTFKKKPNFIHRFFTKLLLGWEWKDYK